MTRIGTISRKTKETSIECTWDLDSNKGFIGTTGIGFFDHMMTLFAKHSATAIECDAKGDLEVDTHHLVEDLGICLGVCLLEALGDKKRIERYGAFTCPMDETLTQVNLDLSGRGYYVGNFELKRDKLGDFETEMLREFLYAFAINAKMNLHVNVLYGINEHHIVESIFKAMGRALKEAICVDENNDEVPSTKGVL